MVKSSQTTLGCFAPEATADRRSLIGVSAAEQLPFKSAHSVELGRPGRKV